jgi:hypothetical protein
LRPASVHFICLIADVDSVLANIFIFLHCQIGFILLRGNIVFDVLMINPIEKFNLLNLCKRKFFQVVSIIIPFASLLKIDRHKGGCQRIKGG